MSKQYSIAGNSGESPLREQIVTYLNTTASEQPVWSPMGRTVEDSSIDADYSEDSKTDIFGTVWNSAKKPKREQEFSDSNLLAGDAVMNRVLDLCIVQQNMAELQNQDCLVVYLFLQDSSGKAFAERYPDSTVLMTSIGGPGGEKAVTGIKVSYGGERVTCTFDKTTKTFTADT
mgnify:FL=1